MSEYRTALERVYDYCALLREQDHADLSVPLQLIVEEGIASGDSEVTRLQAEVQRLRDALAFYANQATWRTTYERMEHGGGRYVTSAILRDEGQRAYEALEER